MYKLLWIFLILLSPGNESSYFEIYSSCYQWNCHCNVHCIPYCLYLIVLCDRHTLYCFYWPLWPPWVCKVFNFTSLLLTLLKMRWSISRVYPNTYIWTPTKELKSFDWIVLALGSIPESRFNKLWFLQFKLRLHIMCN